MGGSLRESPLPGAGRRDGGLREPALRDTLHRRLLAAPFDPAVLERPELRARLARMLRDEAPLLAAATAYLVLDELVDDVGGLGPLETVLRRATIPRLPEARPSPVVREPHCA